MITSYNRGHKIKYDPVKKKWFYLDNGKEANHDRPCPRCGKMPTKEGYDACLGYIKGAKSACCGHGVKHSYVMLKKND